MAENSGIQGILKCVHRLGVLQHIFQTNVCLTTYVHFQRRHKSAALRSRFMRTYIRPGCRRFCDVPSKKDSALTRLIHSWTEALSRDGVPEAGPSVDLIVAHAFGKKMIHEVDMNIQPSSDILRRIDEMCLERAKRIPVQYIIGEWDFHYMTLKMRPPVFIPRPETEELADIIVNRWPRELQQGGKFLEIGCGTGALSLYILKQLSNTKCVAVDKNKTACDLTLKNAARHNLEDRIHVTQGDIYDGSVISNLCSLGPYDVVVSNPPYLTSDEMTKIEAEVATHEDHDAFYGGADGLDIIRRILTLSHKLLRSDESFVWLEVGLQQPELIKKITESHPEYMLSYEETLKDFTQRDRFCKLRLQR